MNRVLRILTGEPASLPKLAAEVSVANTEVINVAETLARQASETQSAELRKQLMEAATRLLHANRRVNAAIETAIGAPER